MKVYAMAATPGDGIGRRRPAHVRDIERVTADRRFHTPGLGGTARTAGVTSAVIEAIHGPNA